MFLEIRTSTIGPISPEQLPEVRTRLQKWGIKFWKHTTKNTIRVLPYLKYNAGDGFKPTSTCKKRPMSVEEFLAIPLPMKQPEYRKWISSLVDLDKADLAKVLQYLKTHRPEAFESLK